MQHARQPQHRHLPAEERKRLLCKSPLLVGVADAVLDELAAATRSRSYAAGDIIVRQGEPGDSMMVVVSGRVKISSVSTKGTELLINIIDPDEIFGEMSLLDGEPRSADAFAVVDTDVLILPRSAFLRVLQTSPAVATKMIEVLCKRIRKTTALVEETVFLDVPKRLFRRLQVLAEISGASCADGVRITHGLSQQELGDAVAASRETVNKQLAEWQRRGLITVGRGSIVVHDMHGLARASGGGVNAVRGR